ncbi:MAG: nitroreductase family protein [Proteobacteria bacterium]|nr:nitroreductase family protein [Pseudomonadota bacterium]
MAENIRIAAASQGYVADISFREDSGMVRLEFLTSTSAESDDLFSAILKRQCTKTPFSGKPLEPDHRRALELSARGNGVRTIIMEDKSRLETIIEFVAQGNGEQLSDPAFQKELASWIRFNPAVAIKFKDGLAGHLAGQPPLPQWLGKALLNFVLTPKNQSDTDAVNIRSSAAVVVFITEDDNPPAWVEVGRVYERFALKACALGIRNAFINQPIEVRKILPELNSWLGLEKGKASLVIRIGYGTEAPFSLRRPVEEIIIQDNAM